MSEVSKKRIHCKVQVWVYYFEPQANQFSFLVLKTTAVRGGFWQPVTGSVEECETLEAAACREVREETGLKIFEVLKKIGNFFEFEGRQGLVHEYGFGLQAKSDSGRRPEIKLDAHEHTDFCWLPAEEALKRIYFKSNSEVLESLLSLVRFQG